MEHTRLVAALKKSVQTPGRMLGKSDLVLRECDIHVVIESMIEHVHCLLSQFRYPGRRHGTGNSQG